MSTIEDEGMRAFMNKKPVDACPYEGQAKVLWKRGYYKQELHEVKEEQNNILEQMGSFDHPHTGLEDIIHNLKNKINKIDHALPR